MKTLIEHCQKLNINELVRSVKSELTKVKLQSKIVSVPFLQEAGRHALQAANKKHPIVPKMPRFDLLESTL